jgi:hypothetical protein
LRIGIDKTLSNNQLHLETIKSIEQIRKEGIDKQTLERVAAARVEMERTEEGIFRFSMPD